MFDLDNFYGIFCSVLNKDLSTRRVKESDIRNGIRDMALLYAPKPQSLQTESITVPNFNLLSHRLAYLHKYAAFHSALVFDMMQLVLQENFSYFECLLKREHFKLCSLGGGPGSDAIGILAAMNDYFCDFMIQVILVDIKESWNETFGAVLTEIKNGKYGSLQQIAKKRLKWKFIKENLLYPISTELELEIATANLITMVKFVSAAACNKTEKMLKRIFDTMKGGALVLFIDNAAGGFNRLFQSVAKKQGFINMFGPLQHYHYSKESMKFYNFGHNSCYQTTVAVYLLQKPYDNHSFQVNFEQNIQIPRNVSVSALQNNSNRIHLKNYLPPEQNHNINFSTPKNHPIVSDIPSRSYRKESYSHLPSSPGSPPLPPEKNRNINFSTPKNHPIVSDIPSRSYRKESYSHLPSSPGSPPLPPEKNRNINFSTPKNHPIVSDIPSRSYRKESYSHLPSSPGSPPLPPEKNRNINFSTPKTHPIVSDIPSRSFQKESSLPSSPGSSSDKENASDDPDTVDCSCCCLLC